MPTRDELAAAIAVKRAKQDRLPAHWEKRREEISGEIDLLIAQWFAAE